MKIRQKLVAILTATLVLTGSFPVFAAETDQIPEEVSLSGPAIEAEEAAEFPVPDEAPAFHARIEFRMGYTVIGTFTDFTPDITRIETLYSLDGENWQTGMTDWNLHDLAAIDEYKLEGLQTQPCLVENEEPLTSYIAGEIDLFYLKLRITKRNGLSYETQSAAIERSGLQPVPEGTECRARFSSSIAVNEFSYPYRTYGRYQLTVPADATAEEISALLPDTLPVEIQMDNGRGFVALGIVDCPVTWKPLSLPLLSAGESITIPDAAEEIVVPAGTQVSTPLGIFQLDEALSLDNLPSTDEVRLVLNVSQEDRNPTGVLRTGENGLEMAFYHKPTGAVSIRAYVLTEGESKWTELTGLSLLKEMNAQSSTANSGYALVLRNDQEPYRSYLAAIDAGETPIPFFVCLKIEGGIYDGRELILPWPDIYEQLPDLPKVRGAEGNEGNAGASNKSDSTESGQRPNLPQTQDNQQADPEGRGQKLQTLPVYVPKTVSAIFENQKNPLSAEAPVSEPSPAPQKEPSISGLQQDQPQTTPDTANSSAANQKSRRIPFFPVATTAAAGGFISAVVCKAAGYRPFYRIAGKIRNILRILHK